MCTPYTPNGYIILHFQRRSAGVWRCCTGLLYVNKWESSLVQSFRVFAVPVLIVAYFCRLHGDGRRVLTHESVGSSRDAGLSCPTLAMGQTRRPATCSPAVTSLSSHLLF